jgi:hypothetical protein
MQRRLMGSNVIAGLDPGFKGGIAYIEYTIGCRDYKLLKVAPLPIHKVGPKGKQHTAYNVPVLKSLLYHTVPCRHYVLEKFLLTDEDGKFSKASTAMGFGLISGLIQGEDGDSRTLHEAWPIVWQSRMFRKITGTRKKGDTKGLSERVALSVFPDAPIYGPRGGIRDGLSDAICIALYGTTLNL